MDQEAAVLLIQRVGRGLLRRFSWFEEVLAKIKVQRMMKRVRFARRIQPLCKAYLCRRDLIKNLKEEEERPIKVMQRFGRGFRERRVFARELAEWKERRRRNAMVIQAYCRGQRSARRKTIQFRRAALRLIQSVGRGQLFRGAAFDLVVKRALRRKKQLILMQSAGRAMLVRTDCKYARQAQIKERRRLFVYETMRFWKAYRLRLSLGRRWRVVQRANQNRLCNVMQRVGEAFFARQTLHPQWIAKKKTDLIRNALIVVQRIGRGRRARAWLQYRHETAQAKLRRHEMQRRTMLTAVVSLQRIGRAFDRRRRCFRRFFKQRKTMGVIASVARGYAARLAIGTRFHLATHRVRERPETPEGDDEKALRMLRKIFHDLSDELMEQQWRVDTLLVGGLHVKIPESRFKLMRNRGKIPEVVYKQRIERLRQANLAIRRKLLACPPERLSALTVSVTETEREHGKEIHLNRSFQDEIELHAPAVREADVELDAVEAVRKREQDVIDKLCQKQRRLDGVAAKANKETARLEQEIAALLDKAEVVEEFEDQDRPLSARSRRRRTLARELEAVKVANIVGSPTNAARRLNSMTMLSASTPPPMIRAGDRAIDASPSQQQQPAPGDDEGGRTVARDTDGVTDDAARLTYHFDSEDEVLDLQRPPPRAESSLATVAPPPKLLESNSAGRSRLGKPHHSSRSVVVLGGSSTTGKQRPDPLSASTTAFGSTQASPTATAATNANFGIVIPMVARMDYGFDNLKSSAAASPTQLRGASTTLVGSPVRSIRVKPPSSLEMLSPDKSGAAAATAGSSAVWSPDQSTIAGDPSVAGLGTSGVASSSAMVVKPAFQPHIVVRTKQDMVYAKMQVQEADAKIATLQFEIEQMERAVGDLQRVAEERREKKHKQQRREEKQRAKDADEKSKLKKELAEDARLKERLQTLQAIAAAEQQAADAALRRAEAEAKLRAELSKGNAAPPPPPPAAADKASSGSTPARRASPPPAPAPAPAAAAAAAAPAAAESSSTKPSTRTSSAAGSSAAATTPAPAPATTKKASDATATAPKTKQKSSSDLKTSGTTTSKSAKKHDYASTSKKKTKPAKSDDPGFEVVDDDGSVVQSDSMAVATPSMASFPTAAAASSSSSSSKKHHGDKKEKKSVSSSASATAAASVEKMKGVSAHDESDAKDSATDPPQPASSDPKAAAARGASASASAAAANDKPSRTPSTASTPPAAGSSASVTSSSKAPVPAKPPLEPVTSTAVAAKQQELAATASGDDDGYDDDDFDEDVAPSGNYTSTTKVDPPGPAAAAATGAVADDDDIPMTPSLGGSTPLSSIPPTPSDLSDDG